MLKHPIEERKRERRRPVAPPSSSHRRRYSARYGLTDPSNLDVYFVGASGIHPSRLQTSSDSSLGGLVTASGGLANALGGLAPTPDDVFFSWGGGGSSACAQIDGQQVLRAASERFLTGTRLDRYKGSKPKELFLQSKEAVQENESDRQEIAQGRHEIQGRHRKERNFTSQ